MIKSLFFVGIGGFAGSILRYLISISKWAAVGVFPTGTLLVNLVGSLMIGLLGGYFIKSPNSSTQLLLVTGFCGGFTTFSTFSLEALKLLREEFYFLFVVYTTGSVLGGLMLCALGFWIMRMVIS